MARLKTQSRVGPDIPEVTEALAAYIESHPKAQLRSYRQNSAAIRVRLIDPSFRDLDRVERHDLIWGYLRSMPEDILSDLTILLLLTPEEVEGSLANFDFDRPIPSDL